MDIDILILIWYEYVVITYMYLIFIYVILLYMFHYFSDSLPGSTPQTSTQILARNNFYTEDYGKKELQRLKMALSQVLYNNSCTWPFAVRIFVICWSCPRMYCQSGSNVLRRKTRQVTLSRMLGSVHKSNNSWRQLSCRRAKKNKDVFRFGKDWGGSREFWEKLLTVGLILGLNRKEWNEIADLLNWVRIRWYSWMWP